jgi:hypothetical protein
MGSPSVDQIPVSGSILMGTLGFAIAIVATDISVSPIGALGLLLLIFFLFTFFLRSKFGRFLLLPFAFVSLSLVSHNLFPLFHGAFDQHIQSLAL